MLENISKQLYIELSKKSNDYLMGSFDFALDCKNLYNLSNEDLITNNLYISIISQILDERGLL